MIKPIDPVEGRAAAAQNLRRRARRARDMAALLIGDSAEQRLLNLAEEYEEQARQLDGMVRSRGD